MAWKAITEINDDSKMEKAEEVLEPKHEGENLSEHLCQIECLLKKILAHIESSKAPSVITYNERHK